jgi:hypothetical protein
MSESLTDSDPHKHPTSEESSSGAAEPDFRSPHTNVHLLKRVTVQCPWWTWYNANTSIV